MEKRWRLLSPQENNVENLTGQLHISPILARLLVNRGIAEADEAERFLDDSCREGYDPFLMKNMDKAVTRICAAMEKKERIVIYGDYDVDGITSTALLYTVLTDLGAAPSFYIPERQSEGYGLNQEALQQLLEEKAQLVITVDCGISSCDLVAQFQDLMDIIITDHHEPPSQIPQCCAVLNPKQSGCTYPCKDLAGVGVAFKLCQALWQARNNQALPGYTELAALGTIADLVSLTDENRLIVQDGLRRMKDGYNIGLQALLEASSLKGDAITAGRIAFTAAPRLNAAGRISYAAQGVQLLLEQDTDKAKILAEELSDLNAERQDIEHTIASQAIAQIEEQGRGTEGVLIAYGEDWHVGVIGIAASRLVETYYRPSLVIGVHDGIGKGSCRSIAGFNMYEALKTADDLLIQYGGHPMAAGFSIETKNIEAFRERLNSYAAGHMTQEDYIPLISVDMELQPQDITLELIDELTKLEPYGMGNSRPVFTLCGGTIEEIRPIGRDKQHLRLTLRTKGRVHLSGVGWGMAGYCNELAEGDAVDVAFQLERNDFNGMSSPQLVVQDIHSPEWDVVLNRDIMIHIYMSMKQCIPDEGMAQWQVRKRMAAAEGDRYGIHTIYTAMQVLKEIGVVAVRDSAAGPSYYFPHLSGKMDLDASLTYVHYRKA